MIISHRSKMIFIHIQRTGGSSIINLLKSHLGEGVEIVAQHGNAKSQENYLLRDYKDYFTFAFVRNPWERIFSWYLLINNENQQGITEERAKFEKFIASDLAFALNDLYFHYNQMDYISDLNGNILTDKIYRFENYSNEVKSLQKDLNLTPLEIKRINSTWKKDYRDYYTEKSQEMISYKCKKDIDYFNYTF